MSDKWLHTYCKFSPCERYRYSLVRIWGRYGDGSHARDHRMCHFLMLNPSTADMEKNDPTVERCERFARGWGYDSLIVTNLFSFRATDPRDMKAYCNPVGVSNDRHIEAAVMGADITILAWGAHGAHMERDRAVLDLLAKHGDKLHCLATTKHGQPRHPLYLKSTLQPVRWSGSSGHFSGVSGAQ